jgi:tetratricopeptide (TPR) repeat protein
MFGSLDLNREKSRIASIKFDAAPLNRVAKQISVPAAQPKLSPSAATLEQAEDLYSKRTLDPAKELYLKALEQDGSPDEHARAWYGLARISVLQKQPDAAVRLFEKTLAASPDDPTKAWSFVYLGRLAMAAASQEHEARLDQQAQQDLDRAAKMFKEAIAVPGVSDQARTAAKTELDKLPK